MTASTYTSVHLAKRPKDVIIPDETFTLKTNDIPKAADLKDGEVLFQSLYLSLDPAMRGWMNGKSILSFISGLYLHCSSSYTSLHLLPAPKEKDDKTVFSTLIPSN